MSNIINSFLSPVERDDYFYEMIFNIEPKFDKNKYNLADEQYDKFLMYVMKSKAKLLLDNLKKMSNDEYLAHFEQADIFKRQKEDIIELLDFCSENQLKSKMEEKLKMVVDFPDDIDLFSSLDKDSPYNICDIVCNCKWPSGTFESFFSEELNPTLNVDQSSIKHRLYICMDVKYMDKFNVDLARELDERNLHYYFKTRVFDLKSYDPCVIYLKNEDEVYRTIAIIRYLMAKHPEYSNHILNPASHFFLIDNCIGYGTENNNKHPSYSRTIEYYNFKEAALANSIKKLGYNITSDDYLERMKLEMRQTRSGILYQTFKDNYKVLFEQQYMKDFGNNVEKFLNYEQKIKLYEAQDPKIFSFYYSSLASDNKVIGKKLPQ